MLISAATCEATKLCRKTTEGKEFIHLRRREILSNAGTSAISGSGHEEDSEDDRDVASVNQEDSPKYSSLSFLLT